MSAILVVLAVLSVVPSLLYFGQRRGRGPGWGLVAASEQKVGQGAYRETHVKRWKRGMAPPVVRIAALSSFFLGQMVVPGGLAAIAGVVFVLVESKPTAAWYVLVLSAPTGMWVAGLLLSAGWTMLESGSRAVFKARRAASWAIGHNLVLMVALGFAVAFDRRDPTVALLPCVYACVSVAQAVVVQWAASAIAAYDEARKNDPAPIDQEIVELAGVH
jgi:hypothetical protein